jgi:hypothetical protein
VQAATLLVIYVLNIIVFQILGFGISRVIDIQFPTLGLMTFLMLFIAAFGLAWFPAVKMAEWLIRSRGYVVETKQSGRTSA